VLETKRYKLWVGSSFVLNLIKIFQTFFELKHANRQTDRQAEKEVLLDMRDNFIHIERRKHNTQLIWLRAFCPSAYMADKLYLIPSQPTTQIRSALDLK